MNSSHDYSPISLGSIVDVAIEKLALGGDGIARLTSAASKFPLVVFIPYAAPGDRLKVKIVELKKNFARGKIMEVLTPSKQRTAPPCPYYFVPGKNRPCGGCNFQHMNDEGQADAKSVTLKETLTKIAGLNSGLVLPILMDTTRRWRYRNKIQIPFRPSKSGAMAGFFVPQSHEIVSIDDCHIHSESVMSLVRGVKKKMDEWGIRAYDEDLERGWLRHLIVREDFATGELLVTFVTRNDALPRAKEWQHFFHKNFPKVVGFSQNINPDQTNVILGRKWNPIFGRSHLVEIMKGLGPNGAALKLKVSAGSFFQVNTGAAEILYRTARDFALSETERGGALDVYCGVGGIALALAPHFGKVTGVEEAHSSIADAKENAKLNGISNAEFIRADAEAYMARRAAAPGSPPSVIVLDPPRAGCAEGVLRKIIALSPGTIVYVSCEPSTLARDLKILCAQKYEVKKVQPVDLFPHSAHIESVALLKRKP